MSISWESVLCLVQISISEFIYVYVRAYLFASNKDTLFDLLLKLLYRLIEIFKSKKDCIN